MEVVVVPLVLHLHEFFQYHRPVGLHAPLGVYMHGAVILRRTYAVYAGDRGDDYDIPSGEERVGRRVAQFVYLVVYGGVLLDEGVGSGDIRLRLVVVVVRDEILHGILGEEVLELRVELGGKGLVRGYDEGGTAEPLYHLGGCECLAGAGNAEQDLVPLPPLYRFYEPLYRPRLVALGNEFGAHGKGFFRSGHPVIILYGAPNKTPFCLPLEPGASPKVRGSSKTPFYRAVGVENSLI